MLTMRIKSVKHQIFRGVQNCYADNTRKKYVERWFILEIFCRSKFEHKLIGKIKGKMFTFMRRSRHHLTVFGISTSTNDVYILLIVTGYPDCWGLLTISFQNMINIHINECWASTRRRIHRLPNIGILNLCNV